MFHNVADINHELRRAGQLGAEAGVNVLERGNDLHQKKDGDADGHDCHRRRIHQGGLDLFAEAIGIFEVGRQARNDFRKQPAFFTRRHHGI